MSTEAVSEQSVSQPHSTPATRWRAAATPAISVAGLIKNFGATRALDHLDLTVQTGEVHGFLGPNGAGKTTTARVLLGLLRKDAGEATVLGGDPWGCGDVAPPAGLRSG